MLWAKGLTKNSPEARKEAGLDPDTGTILVKCPAEKDAETYIVPPRVEKVMSDAFDGFDKLKIVVHQEIEDNLTFFIKHQFELKVLTFSPKEFLESTKYDSCIAITNVPLGIAKTAIKKALCSDNPRIRAINGQLRIIDADDVPSICEEMKIIGMDNLIEIKDDMVCPFRSLPLLRNRPVSQEDTNEIISQEGFGILLLKNLNEDNYRSLPHNFIYNLIKHHSFNHTLLSPKWIVVVEVGKNVLLDAPGGAMCFNGDYFTYETPADYIKHMKEHGRVIEHEKAHTSVYAPLFEDNEDENSDEKDPTKSDVKLSPKLPSKGTDWEERHFKICLALISNPELSRYFDSTLIIKRADSIVEKLKKHYQEQSKQ